MSLKRQKTFEKSQLEIGMMWVERWMSTIVKERTMYNYNLTICVYHSFNTGTLNSILFILINCRILKIMFIKFNHWLYSRLYSRPNIKWIVPFSLRNLWIRQIPCPLCQRFWYGSRPNMKWIAALSLGNLWMCEIPRVRSDNLIFKWKTWKY